VTTLPGSATSFADNSMALGARVEYRIQKSTSGAYAGFGYISVGLKAPLIENRGKLMLVVDNTHAAALTNELRRLEQDFVGDGWAVVRRDVSPTSAPPAVKAVIKSVYDSDPGNVKAVFLFGRIAVPRSGNVEVDGHPDHKGAWAADTYYADMDGVWTDSTVTSTTAERAVNHNVPGDGRFDQSNIPSDLELQVGRVDLSNMTCFSNKTPSRSELDLLRQYLNKDHNLRHGRVVLPRRGAVCDNFGQAHGEAFAATGWRAFAPMFGASNNVQIPGGAFFPTLSNEGYLFTYGTGGGGYYTCNGVGGSDDFALNDIKTVFTSFFGSYFGDFDNESNFLRAALGSSSYTLTTSWSGRPHWFYHHMALGETIGHSALLSQNNAFGGLYENQNYGTRMTHTALLGDPTLRLHPVLPPSNVTATQSGAQVTLNWTVSADTALQGYHVYRAPTAAGPFTRLTPTTPVAPTTFTDNAPTNGSVYMVRAIKLETSGSGTYLNPSQGIFAVVDGSTAEPTPPPTPTPAPTPPPTPTPVTLPIAPSGLAASALSGTQIKLTWKDNSTNESAFRILRVTGSSTIEIGKTAANVKTFTNSSLAPGQRYSYRVQAVNSAGLSQLSAAISVTTPATPNAPGSLTGTALNDTSIRLIWADNSANESGFHVYRKTATSEFQLITNINANTRTFTNSGLAAGTKYFYKVAAFNGNGLSATSLEASATTLPAPAPPPTTESATAATFVRADGAPSGTWTGVYGSQGNWINSETPAWPSGVAVTTSNASEWIWDYAVNDPAALQVPGLDARVAACWYSTAFDINVNVTDGSSRQFALYLLDWDNSGRVQQVDVLDATTGAVLNTQTISGFLNGKYLVWNIKGNVRFRLTNASGPNAVVSGMFMDAAQSF